MDDSAAAAVTYAYWISVSADGAGGPDSAKKASLCSSRTRCPFRGEAMAVSREGTVMLEVKPGPPLTLALSNVIASAADGGAGGTDGGNSAVDAGAGFGSAINVSGSGLFTLISPSATEMTVTVNETALGEAEASATQVPTAHARPEKLF